MNARIVLIAAAGIIAGCAQHPQPRVVVLALPQMPMSSPPAPIPFHFEQTHAEKQACAAKASCAKTSCSGS